MNAARPIELNKSTKRKTVVRHSNKIYILLIDCFFEECFSAKKGEILEPVLCLPFDKTQFVVMLKPTTKQQVELNRFGICADKHDD